MAKVDFIGIGAYKAGTTWLYQCLREHPEVCMSATKELTFFSNDRQYHLGLDWYLRHFSHCADGQIKGEISPPYLSFSEVVAARIKRNFPDAKLIVMLRHPVDRAYSHYLHAVTQKRIPSSATFAQALNDYPNLIGRSKYARDLRNFYKHFPKKQVLVLFYDDLVGDPDSIIKETYGFLNVDKNFIPSVLRNKVHSSAARASPVYRPISRTYLKMRKNAAGRLVIKLLRALGLRGSSLQESVGKMYPPAKISPADRKAAAMHFEADISELESLTARDLSRWRL